MNKQTIVLALLCAGATPFALVPHLCAQDVDVQTTPAPPATPTPAVETGSAVNILSPEYTEVISAPNDECEKILTGGFKLRLGLINKTVLGFKDGKAATIAAIRVYIPESDEYNIKSVVLMIGDVPTGPFRPTAKIGDILNAKVFKTKGWQQFTFSPVTAKFIMLSLDSYAAPSRPDRENCEVRVGKDGDENGLQLIGTINP